MIWKATKNTFNTVVRVNVFKLSAALAYYTIFALPGLLIAIVFISDIFYGKQTVESSLYSQLQSFIGAPAAKDIQQTFAEISYGDGNRIATIIGIGALLFGATSMFGEIQDSINMIWKLKAKPKKGRGWFKFLMNRLLSFSMIITLGFLLLVSLLINGFIDFAFNKLMAQFPEITVVLVYIVNTVVTFLLTAFIFGLIFKILPDAKITWKDVRSGAFTTALLFLTGKFLITYYLGHNQLVSVYKGAGSVIIVLLWVYYSSIILYFGAAFTKALAVERGSDIYPNEYAVWVENIEVQTGTNQ